MQINIVHATRTIHHSCFKLLRHILSLRTICVLMFLKTFICAEENALLTSTVRNNYTVCNNPAFHDTDTDILARILADTSDTRDFLKLFLWQAERHADIG